jgi:hypothetical protein
MGEIIEAVTFRLTPETDEASFVAAVAQSLPFLERQPGFLRREVAVSADGEWTDLVYWSSLEAALRAARAFNAAPETQAFNACLERGSVQMRHYRSVYQAG